VDVLDKNMLSFGLGPMEVQVERRCRQFFCSAFFEEVLAFTALLAGLYKLT